MDKSEFKAARKSKSMTQKELSTFLGATLSAVQKWETGQNKIPGWVVDKLKKGSSVTLSGLSASEYAEMERNASKKGMTPDEYVSQLVKSFLKLTVFAILFCFLGYHMTRSPKRWTPAALVATAKTALVHVAKLAR